ncbi:MAG TPA: S8 family serine peptidase [Pyrinomonadaceae bacterium]|nr:S8 family serine peptidase [Pyrinomonadaceae bacterium]
MSRTSGQSKEKQQAELFKGRKVARGQVLVKFNKSATTRGIAQAKQDADADLDKNIGGTGFRLIRSRSKDTATLIQELSIRDDVLRVEPNYVISVGAVPNDPKFSELWGLQNTGQVVGGVAGVYGADVEAASAWDISTGGRSNVVAVVDSGVDYTHPDLAANMWSAPAAFNVTIGGQTISCAAGTRGFDAINRTCNPMDDNGHGTHVAGTIGAVGNNGVGVVGVNQAASVMALKVLDADGNGTIADAVDALEFAIQVKQSLGVGANLRVLSASWGWAGEASQALLDQINRAGAADMLFVAAAGNGGLDRLSDDNDATPYYPATYDAVNVLSVAATDNRDALASFSNYGAQSVDLGAPGVNVVSTYPANRYASLSGTSMATPHVSGAAALVLSRCNLNTANLKAALLGNVTPVAALLNVTLTGGRLNVNRAIRSCAPAVNLAPSVRLTAPASGATFTAPATIALSADASDTDGSISKVQFYAGTQLIGTATTSPYSVNWSSVPAGDYSLTSVATDNLGATATSAAVNIKVNASTAAPFLEQGGQVVIEAENYHQVVNRNSKSWTLTTDRAGYVGSGAMFSGPDTNVQLSTGYTNTSPELRYQVEFAAAGTYYVWLRAWANDTSDNSVHVGLDGQAVTTADHISVGSYGAWTWVRSTMDGPVATINVNSAGLHTINVWMREDGLRVDRLLLTTNSLTVPTGNGPAESSRSTGGPPPPPLPPPAAYIEQSGMVVMEAERADSVVSRGGKSWTLVTDKSGYAGTGSMFNSPNTGTQIDTGYTTTSPEMQYRVQFTTTGTYYVWLRAWAIDTNDNSVNAGLNGQASSTADRMTLGTYGSWAWTRTTMDGPVATITVTSAGVHTFNIWMREDGIRIDRILLTTSSSFVPAGSGPAESPR